ncbi:MAG: DUF4399 domain-containing protein [Nitrospinota bacterium]|nr:DUF4399 domain-containing protein [Nitrospinota bacterium]
MNKRLIVVLAIFSAILASMAWAGPADFIKELKEKDIIGGIKSPAGAKVYFISPKDGETVTNPVLIQFGLKVMGVAPAQIRMQNTGHHHLIINKPLLKIDLNRPLDPEDPLIRHYDNGETETLVKFGPGVYKLRLILGNDAHIPHDPPVLSEEITITVQ